jgi:hypothetical protein
MKKRTFIFLAVILLGLVGPGARDAFAMRHGGRNMGDEHMNRYGGYCMNKRWGGMYGARRTVTTEEEVKALLKEFLKETDLSVGEVRDRDTYFEADIFSADKEKIDILIVDKRTCRIRSAY